MEGKWGLFNKRFWVNWLSVGKNISLISPLTPYIEINFRSVIGLNVNSKTITILEIQQGNVFMTLESPKVSSRHMKQ